MPISVRPKTSRQPQSPPAPARQLKKNTASANRPETAPASTTANGTASKAPLWAAALLVLAALLVYCNSFTGPFIYDDDQAILQNNSIHSLWPIWGPLSPPGELTVGGRPIFNLTFAIDYAISGLKIWGDQASGLDVWSYHASNLLFHIAAGLALFGVLRRTLLQPALRDRFGPESLLLAFSITLLWIVDPIQTDSVTYVSQRAESLMGFFYLLTLYGFIRATEARALSIPWAILCVVACYLGMATKEVMITAPVVVLIYDRTFVAGTFSKAFQQRWVLYAGLASSWLFLLYLLQTIGQREVGFDRGVSSWSYALTECKAIVLYLKLMAWPHPLLIDYGMTMVTDPLAVLPQALVVLVLLAISVVAFVRWPLPGFAGVWFFIILAPTSTVIPILLSPIGEHRLYLPLAAFLALLVIGLYLWIGRKYLGVVLFLALVWGILTLQRNEDYRSAIAIWASTLEQAPDNARVHNNYGVALLNDGQLEASCVQFDQAVHLNANYADAFYNYGNAFLQMAKYSDAISHYEVALQLKPNFPGAHNNWANSLVQLGRYDEAVTHYQAAIQLDPHNAGFHYNWAHLLLQENKYADTIEQCQEALQINPNMAEAINTMGIALFQLGRKDEAIAAFHEALRVNPKYAPALDNLTKLGAIPR